MRMYISLEGQLGAKMMIDTLLSIVATTRTLS